MRLIESTIGINDRSVGSRVYRIKSEIYPLLPILSTNETYVVGLGPDRTKQDKIRWLLVMIALPFICTQGKNPARIGPMVGRPSWQFHWRTLGTCRTQSASPRPPGAAATDPAETGSGAELIPLGGLGLRLLHAMIRLSYIKNVSEYP